MREIGNRTGLPIHVYGPETHITAIVPLALGLAKLEDHPEFDSTDHDRKPAAKKAKIASEESTNGHREALKPQLADHEADHNVENFTAITRCVVYGLQQRAVQGMLDFDFMCKREKPSVAAMISPFSSNHNIKVSVHRFRSSGMIHIFLIGVSSSTGVPMRSWSLSIKV